MILNTVLFIQDATERQGSLSGVLGYDRSSDKGPTWYGEISQSLLNYTDAYKDTVLPVKVLALLGDTATGDIKLIMSKALVDTMTLNVVDEQGNIIHQTILTGTTNELVGNDVDFTNILSANYHQSITLNLDY